MDAYNYLFKFIIVGDSNVEKSCFLLPFTDQKLAVEFGSRNMNIKDKQIKLQIWDTAGQESFRSITRSYYRGSIGGIIVFDVSNRISFDNIIKWHSEIQAYASDKIEIFLVGNKIDLEDKREVSQEEAQKLAKKYGFEYFETSAKTGQNVVEVFESLAYKVLNKIDNGEIEPTQEVQFSQAYGIQIGSIGLKKKPITETDKRDASKQIGSQNQTKEQEGKCW